MAWLAEALRSRPELALYLTLALGHVLARVWLSGVAALALLSLAASVAHSETLTVELLNGDTVTGEVVERTEHGVVLQHPVLGRLAIPLDQVTPGSVHPGLLGTSILAGWRKELDVGFAGSSGDTDESDLQLALVLDRADERHHWRIEGRYDLGYSDGDVDENDARATALHDWLWPSSRWFAFVYGIYDYDDFEAWEHRTTLGAGPGYHLAVGPPFTLDARFGPFVTYEFGDEDTARPEAAVGLFGTWQVREGHTVALSNIYFQTLDEAELRDVAGLEWRIRLAFSKGVSLRLGARNEYDTASRDSKNNLKYYSTLSFDL